VDEAVILPQTLFQEAVAELHTIRDFHPLCRDLPAQRRCHIWSRQRRPFAEATALVMQTLSLNWDADEEILDARLLPSERRRIVELLEKRVNDRIPLAYLLNLAYFCGHPFYVDERVLVPRSPIAELINENVLPRWASMSRSAFWTCAPAPAASPSPSPMPFPRHWWMPPTFRWMPCPWPPSMSSITICWNRSA
jgi:hypothetical protein